MMPPANRHLRASACVVLFAAAMLGWFALRTWVNRLPATHPPEFGAARWIEAPGGGPTAYFRSKIFLDETPRRAWLLVSATDGYELYVNGKLTAKANETSACATGMLDVTETLVQGRNSVAVRVARLSYPGAAQVRVRFGVVNSSTKVREFVSDATWRASSVPLGVQGGTQWKATRLDDSVWPLAIVAEGNLPVMQPLDFPGEIIRDDPTAKWIGTPRAGAAASFAAKVRVPANFREAWLKVAANGNYLVAINGRPLVQRFGEAGWIDGINATDWFHAGENEVRVRVRTNTGAPELLAQISAGRAGESLVMSAAPWTADDSAATVLANYGERPRGDLQSRVVKLQPLPGDEWRDALRWAAVFGGSFAVVLGAWFLFGWAHAKLGRESFADGLRRDAVAHLPVAVFLSALLLLAQDLRCAEDRWFTSAVMMLALGTLLVSKLLLLAAGSRFSAGELLKNARNWRPALAAALAGIVVAGFFLRLHGVADVSLDHDELSLVRMSRGVLTTGYPHDQTGDANRNLTTYEATTYPLALAGFLSGWSEGGVRLPAVIFGSLTILVLGVCGARMMGSPTGLLAAAIYAVLPSAIQWARNAFWPQQTTFAATLTVWLFYEAIRRREIHGRFATLASAGISLAYLSWEGSGFIIPALGVSLLVLRWRDWSWLRDWHLWRCLVAVAAVIVIQQSYRALNSSSYLLVGPGLSDLKAPSLFFLTPMFDPSFYFTNLLDPENHHPLALLGAVSAICFHRDRAIRFLTVVFGTLLLCYTAFLSVYAVRYAHWFLPVLVLLAAGGAVKFVARVLALARTAPEHVFAWTTGACSVAALVAVSGSIGLKPFRIAPSPGSPVFRTRDRVYQYDYRDASRYVRDHAQPGDVVIPNFPHTFLYYAGWPGDYFLTSLLAKRMLYDELRDVPVFTDRFSGLPVLRDLGELREVIDRSARTWIVSVPIGSFANVNDPALPKLLVERGEIVFETYNAQVFLCRGTSKDRPDLRESRTGDGARLVAPAR